MDGIVKVCAKLNTLIDDNGLVAVLDALERVCYGRTDQKIVDLIDKAYKRAKKNAADTGGRAAAEAEAERGPFNPAVGAILLR